jgi:hypothetical protein
MDILEYFYKNVLNFEIKEQEESVMVPLKSVMTHFKKIMIPLCSTATLKIYSKRLRAMKVQTGEFAQSKLHLNGAKEALLLD